MAIDPIKILPRFSPIPLPSRDDSRFGERMMMEVFQNELLQQREADKEVSDTQDQFNTLLAKDPSTGLNPNIPYQQKGIEVAHRLLQESAQKMQQAKNNPHAMKQAITDYQIALSTNPDYRGAVQDKVMTDAYTNHIMNLGDRADPTMVDATNKLIADGKRDKALTPSDLNLGAHALGINEYGNKFLDTREHKDETVLRDDNGRILAIQSKNSIYGPGKIEDERKKAIDDLTKYFSQNTGLAKVYGDPNNPNSDAGLRARATEIVMNRELKNSGQNLDSLKGTPSAGRTALTFQDKEYNKLKTGRYNLGPQYNGIILDDQGTPRILDANKNDIGTSEDLWDNLPEGHKQILRNAGLGSDRYKVAGSNKSIAGTSGLNEPVIGGGMFSDDTKYIKDNGIASKADVTESNGVKYVETNNPKVLEKLGFTLVIKPVDPKKPDGDKNYVLRDKGGKEYPESHDGKGIFATSGGNGSERLFQVKVDDIQPDIKGQPVDFTPTGDLRTDTHNFIGHGESNGADYNAVNPNDNNWVSVGFYQFNTKADQDAMYAAGGKTKEWTDLKTQIPKLSSAERTAKIQALANSMTPEEQKAYQDKQEELADNNYFKPLDIQLQKDKIGVPGPIVPLLRDMAIQHTNGMLLKNKDKLYDKVKGLIAKSGTDPDSLKRLAQDISNIRAEYVKKYTKLSDSVKEEILGRRIPEALTMTNALINQATGAAPAVPVAPADSTKAAAKAPGVVPTPTKTDAGVPKRIKLD